jgi:hypothetical protein
MNTLVRGNRRQWVIGTISGAIALAALIAGSGFGKVSPSNTAVNPRIIAWSSALAILIFGGLATSRLARAFSQGFASRPITAAGGAIRIITGALGILFVVFSILTVLDVNIDKLLVGVGLAGVVLGIAAQQSLGNIFAGFVLVTVRPFRIGDHVRIRSGALGGIFDAWVREMTLTYVTLQTSDGELKVPNSAMLAAAVGPIPPGTPVAPAPTAPAAPAATAPAAPAAPPATPANPAAPVPATSSPPEPPAGTGGPAATGSPTSTSAAAPSGSGGPRAPGGPVAPGDQRP